MDGILSGALEDFYPEFPHRHRKSISVGIFCIEPDADVFAALIVTTFFRINSFKNHIASLHFPSAAEFVAAFFSGKCFTVLQHTNVMAGFDSPYFGENIYFPATWDVSLSDELS